VLYMLEGLGIETGINLDKLVDVACFVRETLQLHIDSNASKALLNRR